MLLRNSVAFCFGVRGVRVRKVRGRADVFPQADPECINTQHTTNDWVLNN